MKTEIKMICLALPAGLVLVGAGCSERQETNDATEIKTLWAEFEEQVEQGELTTEEAKARFAEAHKANEEARLEAVRAALRKQVADGELSKAEAQVRLAGAHAAENEKARAGARKEVSPELQALGAELKEQVTDGTLTEEEANDTWIEARKKAGAEGAAAGTKGR